MGDEGIGVWPWPKCLKAMRALSRHSQVPPVTMSAALFSRRGLSVVAQAKKGTAKVNAAPNWSQRTNAAAQGRPLPDHRSLKRA